MLDECDMETVEDLPRIRVPETVGLRIGHVANQDAMLGSLIDLRVVSLDQCEGLTPDFMEVGLLPLDGNSYLEGTQS